MFAQATPALERSQGGLGIGLSLARGLVEMHGGSITARSAGVGTGSRFSVTLPALVDRPAPARAAPIADPRVGPRLRILVADDNSDSVETMALLLEFMGHEVRTAGDGQQAVEAAEAFRPAVVLLDIGMPRMNGYEAARAIRREPWGQGMLLIALTGWGQEEDRQRAFDAGFDRHFVKQIAPEAIADVLAGMAGSAE
jgi:CheY-like chemotaxis protein